MEITPQYVDLIVDMAREVEAEDPIDWGMLNVNEDEAYRLIALNVIEMFKDKYDRPGFNEIATSTIVKLVVENFVLNLKLRGQYGSKTV